MIPVARALLLPLLLAATASAAEKSSGLPKSSPFLPSGAAASVIAANENIEFAGVSSLGKRTDLIFYDKTTKKSHWIGLGETKEGIAVLTYDARRDQVVVKVNGVEKTLALRKGTGPVNSPAPVAPLPVGFNTPPPPIMPTPLPALTQAPGMQQPSPLPAPAQNVPKPDGPATPETQAKQETEARMLVSDLLEIGMAQRKAYEEQQRKAASGGAPAAQPPTSPAPEPAKP